MNKYTTQLILGIVGMVTVLVATYITNNPICLFGLWLIVWLVDSFEDSKGD